MLAFNLTKISSLEHFPKLPSLKRVELADNFLKGAELAHLCQCENLETIKLANNKIASIDDLKCFTSLKKLQSLDLLGNPVCDVDSYQEKMWEMIPTLLSLDGLNEEGDEVDSDMDDYGDDYGAEEGEEELDEEALMEHLTEEQKKEMKDKGMSAAEYLNQL